MRAIDIERIGFVTRHFNALQGLRFGAPAGLTLMAMAILPLWRLSVPLLLLVAGFLACASGLAVRRAKAYYSARFGTVDSQVEYFEEPVPLSIYRSAGAGSLNFGSINLRRRPSAFNVVVFLAQPVVFTISFSHPQPLARPYCLYAGVLFLAYWWLEREHRLSQAYFTVSGTLLLFVAGWGEDLGLLARRTLGLNQVLLLIGASLVLCGLLDHRHLTRSLSPLASKEESNG